MANDSNTQTLERLRDLTRSYLNVEGEIVIPDRILRQQLQRRACTREQVVQDLVEDFENVDVAWNKGSVRVFNK